MRKFKKRWEQELDSIIPELDEQVKNEPIQTAENNQNVQIPLLTRLFNLAFGTRRAFATTVTSFALVLVLCFSLIFGLPQAKVSKAGAVVLVEVNPSVIFCADDKDKVCSVTATNPDADVVIAHIEQDLIGLSLEDAVNRYLDVLAKTGYLPESGAIKISGTGKQNIIDDARTSAQNYFMNKGLYVAVAGGTLDSEQFCDYAGIESFKRVKGIYNYFNNVQTLYSSRLQSENPQKNLGELYEEVVPEEYVIENFALELKEHITSVSTYLDELTQIQALNERIREHEDNPMRYLLGYFELLSSDLLQQAKSSELLNALILQMQDLLNSLQTNHGIALESSFELDNKVVFLNLFIQMMDALPTEYLLQNFESILGLLTEINADVQKITSMFALPQSVEQYFEKLNAYFYTRVQHYSEIYNAVREKISLSEYQSFIDELKSTYGSLDNYWDSLN